VGDEPAVRPPAHGGGTTAVTDAPLKSPVPQTPRAVAFRPSGLRVVTAPTIVQMDAVECGAACLVSILAFHGRHISIEEARRVCGVSRDGSSALQLTAAASNYGLKCEGYGVDSAELRDLQLPGILYWGFDHFVVLEGWSRGRWRIMDPSIGHRWVSAAEFDEKFTGVVLELTPTADFRRGGRTRGVREALVERMRGSWRVVAATAACGVLLAVPAFTLPALGAVYVDRVLLEGANGWLLPMILLALAAMVVSAVLAYVQQQLLAKLEQRLAMTGAARFFDHLLRLPVEFYSHRYTGDIVQRLDAVELLAGTFASKIAPALVGLLTSTLFIIALFVIDKHLALIATGIIAVVILIVMRSGRALVDRTRTLEKDIGLGAGTLSAGLAAIETVKSSGRENDLFARIADANARTATSAQALEGLSTTLTAAPEFLVSLLVSAIVLAFGGWQVMQGHITIGSLLAFQAILVVAMGPVLELASLGQEIQSLNATMARIDDVLRHPRDPLALPVEPVELVAAANSAAGSAQHQQPALAADALEFRHVVFGYSEAAEPLIRDFTLRIAPGHRVAIVGVTGSGKSTAAKLAAGLYSPWSGEVLIDGRPLASIPRHERVTAIAVVGQTPILFAASLRDNLSMWDPLIPDAWMREATNDAGLAGLIEARGGLGMMIAEGGINLSGGEAQRVEIARALSRRPSILILDEATSSLDATTESQIDRALRRRGCACLVIAHRLSTIRDADEIVVLDRGVIVERGSHDELMALNGAYVAFIRGGGQG
jgi:ATP-binding cassette subfamily C protein